MTETKDTADKTLRGAGRKPLSLQRTVESGHVRQNFSHGRSKSVVVEKRKTRKLAAPGAPGGRGRPRAGTPQGRGESAPRRLRRAPSRKAERGQAPTLLRPEERDADARSAEARKQQAKRGSTARRAGRAAALRAAPPERQALQPTPRPPHPFRRPEQAPAPAAAGSAAERPSSAPSRPTADDRVRSPRSRAAAASATSFDHRLPPREGGRPKQIDIPLAAKPAARHASVDPSRRPRRLRGRTAADMGDEDETRAIKRGGKLVRAPVKAPVSRREARARQAHDQQRARRAAARALARLARSASASARSSRRWASSSPATRSCAR